MRITRIAAAVVLPRLEHAYLPERVTPIALGSARQYFSAIASRTRGSMLSTAQRGW
jgi:hypothetical protein